MIKCSIGICVYNEEKNIAKLIHSFLAQNLNKVIIDEIIIIASGPTDNTCNIVKTLSKTHKKIQLIKQEKREGKASAVNLFIKKSRNEILVLSSGDLLLKKDVIEKLVSKFADTQIGMTGARPVPVNNINDGFCSFAGHLLWDLHHRISLRKPKMGELVAFRKIFKRIPTIGADEASIEPLIRGQGYIIKYVPDAIIYNKTPTTIIELIQQRRRNYWLHLVVKYEQSYVVSTLNIFTILQALYSFIKEDQKVKHILFISMVVLLEAYSRFLGWWDYRITKKRHTVWKFIETTKKL